MGRAAPASNDTLSGNGKTIGSGTATVSANAPSTGKAATRSPGLNALPGAASRTTPAHSAPGTKGRSGRSW